MRSVAVCLMEALAVLPAWSQTGMPRAPAAGTDLVVLHGRVLSVTGQSIPLRTDDGRSIFVNRAGIPAVMIPFLAEDHRAAVLGTFGLSSTSFVGQVIERVG